MIQPLSRDAPRPGRSRQVRSWRARSPKCRLCAVAATLTAASFALPVGEVMASSRGSPHAAFARQCAMYLAHVTFGLSHSEVARGFGRDRTTAAHACRLVEERRDDAAVDAVLDTLERIGTALHVSSGTPVQP